MTKAGKWRSSSITNLVRRAEHVVKIAVVTTSVVIVTVGAIVILAGIMSRLPYLIALILQLQ